MKNKHRHVHQQFSHGTVLRSTEASLQATAKDTTKDAQVRTPSRSEREQMGSQPARQKGKQINKTGCKKHRETRNGQVTNQKTKELGQRNKPDVAATNL